VHEAVNAYWVCNRVTRGRVNPLVGRYVIRVGHSVTHRGIVKIANTTRAGDKMHRLIMTSSHFILVHPICEEFKHKVSDEFLRLFLGLKLNLKVSIVCAVQHNIGAVFLVE
jgi:hypothetical protein